MLALILRAAGWHPSFLIGGELNEVGTNAVFDSGEWLVVEADESDGTFLELAPHDAVVTSVLPDHLDHYGDFAGLVEAFRGVRRPHPRRVRALRRRRGRGVHRRARRRGARRRRSSPTASPTLPTTASTTTRVVAAARSSPWLHRGEAARRDRSSRCRAGTTRSNAAGAAAIALELGVPFDAVTRALGGFGGVARRFQFRGERDGVTYVDDYAHLPSDVDAMIRAAREGGWERVVAVFQPHRYTRTAALWRDFADAFAGADALVLTDVYSAGEQPQPGVSGRLVLRAVLDAHPEQAVTYLPRRADLVAHVPRLARPGDVVLTLGAGDLTTAPDEWLAPRS